MRGGEDLAEAWKKHRYGKALVSKLIDCAGETEVWLDFSRDFGYLDAESHQALLNRYDEVSRMLSGMIEKASKFIPYSLLPTPYSLLAPTLEHLPPLVDLVLESGDKVI